MAMRIGFRVTYPGSEAPSLGVPTTVEPSGTAATVTPCPVSPKGLQIRFSLDPAALAGLKDAVANVRAGGVIDFDIELGIAGPLVAGAGIMSASTGPSEITAAPRVDLDDKSKFREDLIEEIMTSANSLIMPYGHTGPDPAKIYAYLGFALKALGMHDKAEEMFVNADDALNEELQYSFSKNDQSLIARGIIAECRIGILNISNEIHDKAVQALQVSLSGSLEFAKKLRNNGQATIPSSGILAYIAQYSLKL